MPAITQGPAVSAAVRRGPPQLGEGCCTRGSPSLTPCAWPPPAGLGCFFWQLGLQRGCQWGSGLVFLFIHCGSGLGVHFVGLQRPSLCPEGLRARLTDEPPPPPRRPTLL